jgi:hypothetical protein
MHIAVYQDLSMLISAHQINTSQSNEFFLQLATQQFQSGVEICPEINVAIHFWWAASTNQITIAYTSFKENITNEIGKSSTKISCDEMFTGYKAITSTCGSRGTDFDDMSIGVFTLHGNNFRCQFVCQAFTQANLMHTNADQFLKGNALYTYASDTKTLEWNDIVAIFITHFTHNSDLVGGISETHQYSPDFHDFHSILYSGLGTNTESTSESASKTKARPEDCVVTLWTFSDLHFRHPRFFGFRADYANALVDDLYDNVGRIVPTALIASNGDGNNQIDYRNENYYKDLHGTMKLDMMLQINCDSDSDDNYLHDTINNDGTGGTLTLHVNQSRAYNEIFCAAFNGTGMFSIHALVTAYVMRVCELSTYYVDGCISTVRSCHWFRHVCCYSFDFHHIFSIGVS